MNVWYNGEIIGCLDYFPRPNGKCISIPERKPMPMAPMTLDVVVSRYIEKVYPITQVRCSGNKRAFRAIYLADDSISSFKSVTRERFLSDRCRLSDEGHYYDSF